MRWTPVPGSTDYEWSYSVALPPAATYQIFVRHESDGGAVQSEARSSGRVSVTSAARLSVTLPRGTTTWRRGSNQAVRWKLSEPVTAGVTSYRAGWKVNAPAGKGYRIVVEHWSGANKLASGQSTGRLTIKR